jgi:hypothetical protein
MPLLGASIEEIARGLKVVPGTAMAARMTTKRLAGQSSANGSRLVFGPDPRWVAMAVVSLQKSYKNICTTMN